MNFICHLMIDTNIIPKLTYLEKYMKYQIIEGIFQNKDTKMNAEYNVQIYIYIYIYLNIMFCVHF